MLLALVSPSTYAAPACKSTLRSATKNGAGGAIIALDAILESAQNIRTKDVGASRKDIVDQLQDHPRFQWIVRRLMDNQVNFAMNRNEKRREAIAERGFLNQFEHRSSGGELNRPLRREVEATYSSLTVQSYDKIPIADRPKYGFLAPLIGDKLNRNSTVEGYGADTYIFKRKKLEDRTTWAPGDTVDQRYQFDHDNGQRKIPRAARFLPWSHRALLIPYLGFRKKTKELSVGGGDHFITLPDRRKLKLFVDTNTDYIELQIWGKLTLDDVESFIFTKNPPAGNFLQALIERNISIYQQFEGKDYLWDPKNPVTRKSKNEDEDEV